MSEVATHSFGSRPGRYAYIAVLLGLLLFVAYGANSSSMHAEAAPGAQATFAVDIDLKEWELDPSKFDFQQGDTVTFNITNTGRFPHNLEVSNAAQHLLSPTIAPGETTTLKVTFDNSGAYTFICAVPGHAALGMSGELTVSGNNPAIDNGEYIGIPAMRVSPRSGAEVEGTSQEVRVTLHDFTLDASSIGGANVAGEGHWALFLDDQLVASLGEPTHLLEDLTKGDHTIRTELRNNDRSPVAPPLGGSSTISVQASQEVDIDLKEWELDPSKFDFQQGDTVIFNVTNSGRFPHNLEVSNTAKHLLSPTIAPGETTTLKVTFDNSGAYTLICAVPGHAALGMSGELTVSGNNPAPATGDFLGIPAMRLSPRNDTAVEGSSQEVRVILHDFTLNADAIGDANVDGEGYWALFLDDELVESLGEPSFTLVGLTAGPHVIKAELRNNDGTPVEPPLETSSRVNVPALSPTPPATPSVGDTVPDTLVLAGIATLGLMLSASGAFVLNRRRV